MKYSKLILILLLFLAFSCSKEEILTTNSNTIDEGTNLNNILRLISCVDEQTTVNVIYDTSNPEWASNSLLVRQNFRNLMSQYFTIISVLGNVAPDCRHTEVWTVDCYEYQLFLKDVKTSGGTNDSYSDEAELKNPNDYIGNCF